MIITNATYRKRDNNIKIPHTWMPINTHVWVSVNTHIRVLRNTHTWVFGQHIINT